ncbi:unnamed protein product [Rotaria sordida]|uniref:RING-type domain-containing protein n=1 Tax=Rotaria sordida TaxID=392033 RepID=A0A814VPP6_9BILA|nr:unnamed protein product [Rotaria sordida]
MAENQNNSSSKRYNSINNEQNRTNSNHEQLIPISIEYLSTPITISNKRCRRSSITNEQSLSTQLCSNNQDFIYDRNLTMTPIIGTRKRSAQDDLVAFTTHQFLQEHEQYTHKRARYENSNSIELENQPPRLTNKRRSLFFHQQQQQQQQQQEDHLSSTWNNHQTTNDISLFFNDIPSSLSHPTITTYHRINSVPNHEHNLSDQYSSLLTEQHHHHHSSIFHNNNNSLITSNQKSTIPKSSKTNIRLLSPQLNSSSPLRTTNFLFDNKQQTIIRTGNISPAHSDSSSESTSTCSSDEQLHHHHYHIYQPQPWRTYRERENYEQLLDLAEKLSDPNRFNKVDIQQFFSYRYKIPTISSKQTACVICMSHFKNGQHIRVLPCQHEYHSKCIARWFAMNSSCPICRRDNFLSSC